MERQVDGSAAAIASTETRSLINFERDRSSNLPVQKPMSQTISNRRDTSPQAILCSRHPHPSPAANAPCVPHHNHHHNQLTLGEPYVSLGPATE